MRIAAMVFTGLAAFCHVLFFVLESVMWSHPSVNKIFRVTADKATVMSTMAYNQGFYNLFLAFGAAFGLFWLARGKESEGRVLIGFTMLCMVGAAGVLLSTSLQLYKGAIFQGLPPLLALVFLFLSNRSEG